MKLPIPIQSTRRIREDDELIPVPMRWVVAAITIVPAVAAIAYAIARLAFSIPS